MYHEPSTDFHLKLNGQSFRIPYELLTQLYDNVQQCIKEAIFVLDESFDKLNALLIEKKDDSLAIDQLNDIIKIVDESEKKLARLRDFESNLLIRIKSRLEFFKELDNIKASPLGTYPEASHDWYRKYTDLLIADYLTRNREVVLNDSNLDKTLVKSCNYGSYDSAGVTFLKQQHLENLLDYDVLITGNLISRSLLKHHDLSLLLQWIHEHKNYLQGRDSNLEFEARLQQYIEHLKSGETSNAIKCYKNHLLRFLSTHSEELSLMSGLMVFIKFCDVNHDTSDHGKPTDGVDGSHISKATDYKFQNRGDAYEYFFHQKMKSNNSTSTKINSLALLKSTTAMDLDIYQQLLSNRRWEILNRSFLHEYYSKYGISEHDPLLIYLSLGISALKTKECAIHDTTGILDTDPVLSKHLNENVLKNNCPVCDDDLLPISKTLPFAHHTQSKLFENPVMLPSGNVYDLDKLKKLSFKLKANNLYNLRQHEVMDPIEKSVHTLDECIRMYPT